MVKEVKLNRKESAKMYNAMDGVLKDRGGSELGSGSLDFGDGAKVRLSRQRTTPRSIMWEKVLDDGTVEERRWFRNRKAL